MKRTFTFTLRKLGKATKQQKKSATQAAAYLYYFPLHSREVSLGGEELD
jgi:hypothetical protein